MLNKKIFLFSVFKRSLSTRVSFLDIEMKIQIVRQINWPIKLAREVSFKVTRVKFVEMHFLFRKGFNAIFLKWGLLTKKTNTNVWALLFCWKIKNCGKKPV